MLQTSRWVLVVTGLLCLGLPAQADVVDSPPSDCPPGYSPGTSHGGPYCRPPKPTCPKGHTPVARRATWYCQPPLPTDCPKEHIPKVRERLAYCEPPPAEACPTGSAWASRSPTDTFCVESSGCGKSGECAKGVPCVESGLCIEHRYEHRRYGTPIVRGTCKTNADCSSPARCQVRTRCDLPKRKASSKKAAQPVPGKMSPDPTPAKPAAVPEQGGWAAGPLGMALAFAMILMVLGYQWRSRSKREDS